MVSKHLEVSATEVCLSKSHLRCGNFFTHLNPVDSSWVGQGGKTLKLGDRMVHEMLMESHV